MEGKITAIDENGVGTILGSDNAEYKFEKAAWADKGNQPAKDMDVTFDVADGAATGVAKKPSKKEAAFANADKATAKVGLIAKIMQSLGKILPGEAGAAMRDASREVSSANNQAKKTAGAAKKVDQDVDKLRNK